MRDSKEFEHYSAGGGLQLNGLNVAPEAGVIAEVGMQIMRFAPKQSSQCWIYGFGLAEPQPNVQNGLHQCLHPWHQRPTKTQCVSRRVATQLAQTE